MARLKLGVDFDGVISDSRFVKQKVIADKFGVKVPADMTGYLAVMKHGYISNEQYQELAVLMYESEIVLETEPVKDAIATIIKLRNIFEVKIVTARTQVGVDLAKRWCKKNGLNDIEIIGTSRQEKTVALKGSDYFVDDDLIKLIPLIGKVPHLYLFSWPYNADEIVPAEITRVWSWKELGNKLEI